MNQTLDKPLEEKGVKNYTIESVCFSVGGTLGRRGREAFSLPLRSTQSRRVVVRGAVGTTCVSLGCLVNKVTLPMSFHAFSLFILINRKTVICFVF